MTGIAGASVIAFASLWAVVFALLAAMVAVDVRERRIPNKLIAVLGAMWTLMQLIAWSVDASAGVSLAEAARACGVTEPLLRLFALPDVLTGVLTAAAAILCLGGVGALYERVCGKQAMGAGDVKLIGAFALFLGPVPTIVCLMLACGFALAAALPTRLRAFPFAPALSLAFICVLLVEL